MRLFLIRHGQTGWNALDKAQGHTDMSLDETGLEQAALLAKAFEGIRLSAVFSSDLSRATQTAFPLAQNVGVPVQTRSFLREKCFGEWEGKPFAFIRGQTPSGVDASDLFHFRAPGGESFCDMWNRLDAAMEELGASEKDTAVVTHGGTACLLLAKLIRADFEASRSFRFSNASITELENRSGTFKLMRYNDIAHLSRDGG